MRKAEARRSEALDALRRCIKPHDTIFWLTRREEGSNYELWFLTGDYARCEVMNITKLVAEALGHSYDEKTGTLSARWDRTGNCWEIGGQVVYALARLLFPDERRPLEHKQL